VKAQEYIRKKKRSPRVRAELYERKCWHLTQILGAILFASEDPETGFTIPEADILEVDIKDVELIRGVGDNGKATVTLRIKTLAEPKAEVA
jgi:hypothetical protein